MVEDTEEGNLDVDVEANKRKSGDFCRNSADRLFS